jgi:hypothetical protein
MLDLRHAQTPTMRHTNEHGTSAELNTIAPTPRPSPSGGQASVGLMKYDAMRAALIAAHRIDEVLEIKNRAVALQAYARQAHDREAEIKLAQIKLRAMRRMGELLIEMGENGERASKGDRPITISADPLTHQRCLALLRFRGAQIEVEHDVHESFSGDRFICARFGARPAGWRPPVISYNRACESLFRHPLYDLAHNPLCSQLAPLRFRFSLLQCSTIQPVFTMATRLLFSFEPMLCKNAGRLRDGVGWRYELKLDGFRALGRKSGRGAQLWLRNQNNFAGRFFDIANGIAVIPSNTLIYGEIVAVDEKGQAIIQPAAKLRRGASAIRAISSRFTIL